MTDMNTPVEERIAQMPHPAQLLYNEILQQADENVFVAVKNLRKSQSDGSIESELRPGANLALVALTAHLNGGELRRTKTDAEALYDIRERIEQARLKGDRESYDALRAG
jgi:hypothetical protein